MSTGWSVVRSRVRAHEGHLWALGLGVIVLATLFAAVIRPLQRTRTFNMSKATGIASSRGRATEPLDCGAQQHFTHSVRRTAPRASLAACPETCSFK